MFPTLRGDEDWAALVALAASAALAALAALAAAAAMPVGGTGAAGLLVTGADEAPATEAAATAGTRLSGMRRQLMPMCGFAGLALMRDARYIARWGLVASDVWPGSEAD